MTKYKLEVDKSQCTACAACTATCPDKFELDDEGKAQPKTAEVNDLGCAMDAAQVCPVQCIHITDNEANKKLI